MKIFRSFSKTAADGSSNKWRHPIQACASSSIDFCFLHLVPFNNDYNSTSPITIYLREDFKFVFPFSFLSEDIEEL